MQFKYTGMKTGKFYGVLVEPDKEYNFSGRLEELALKSADFKKAKDKDEAPKVKIKTKKVMMND